MACKIWAGGAQNVTDKNSSQDGSQKTQEQNEPPGWNFCRLRNLSTVPRAHPPGWEFRAKRDKMSLDKAFEKFQMELDAVRVASKFMEQELDEAQKELTLVWGRLIEAEENAMKLTHSSSQRLWLAENTVNAVRLLLNLNPDTEQGAKDLLGAIQRLVDVNIKEEDEDDVFVVEA